MRGKQYLGKQKINPPAASLGHAGGTLIQRKLYQPFHVPTARRAAQAHIACHCLLQPPVELLDWIEPAEQEREVCVYVCVCVCVGGRGRARV